MEFNETKTIPWNFFVQILQVFKYFSWLCPKGQFLIRKTLGEHEKLNFLRFFLFQQIPVKGSSLILSKNFFKNFLVILGLSQKKYWIYQMFLFNKSPSWRQKVQKSTCTFEVHVLFLTAFVLVVDIFVEYYVILIARQNWDFDFFKIPISSVRSFR